MPDTARTPFLEEIRESAKSGRNLVSTWNDVFSKIDDCVWRNEEQLAEAIGKFADAIRPLRGLEEDSFTGWPHAVWMGVRDAITELDMLASEIKLERMTAPRAERDAYKLDC